jgi:hypothetical protein
MHPVSGIFWPSVSHITEIGFFLGLEELTALGAFPPPIFSIIVRRE